MFAVIRTGGKQYRVAAEDVIQVDKVKGDPGEIVQFGEVLLLGGEGVTLGAPTIPGASVAAEVLEQGRGSKIIVFKKRRRKNSRRKRGHRQEFTLIRITEILTDGAQPSKTARPKAERRPRAPETAQAPAQESPRSAAQDAPAAASRETPTAARPAAEGKASRAKPKSQAKTAKKPAASSAKSKAAKPKSGGKGKKK